MKSQMVRLDAVRQQLAGRQPIARIVRYDMIALNPRERYDLFLLLERAREDPAALTGEQEGRLEDLCSRVIRLS